RKLEITLRPEPGSAFSEPGAAFLVSLQVPAPGSAFSEPGVAFLWSLLVLAPGSVSFRAWLSSVNFCVDLWLTVDF
ncbi:hypothetical protein L195_g057902, partial [Trifolium pratense]